MSYLSHVVDQRSMLRVAGEILLAFCLVTPLMLLLCFLVWSRMLYACSFNDWRSIKA